MRRIPASFLLFLTSHSQAQLPTDPWAAARPEPKPSLTLRWSPAGTSTWKPGPAPIPAGTEIDLKIEAPAGSQIRWFQIIPDTSRFYKNANHPWEPDPYKWVGFGKIDYLRRELTDFRGQSEITLSTPASFAHENQPNLYRPDLGSFWISAEALTGDRILRSPGLAENTDKNLSPSVFRISVRKDDSYLGHLTTFFNVPGLFGSIPYQCSHYIGVDCADVLVSAHRIWRKKPGDRDYNVSMLVSEWPEIARFEIAEGTPAKPISWGKDILPGDLIAVRYPGRTQFQHIGSLYEDKDQSGTLTPADLVLHAGPKALHLTPLACGSFDGTAAIFRPPK